MKIPFKQNEGVLDRILRLGFGTVLIVLWAFTVQGTFATILLILSLIPFVTGMTGFCPTYTLLGISTRREGGGVDITKAKEARQG